MSDNIIKFPTEEEDLRALKARFTLKLPITLFWESDKNNFANEIRFSKLSQFSVYWGEDVLKNTIYDALMEDNPIGEMSYREMDDIPVDMHYELREGELPEILPSPFLDKEAFDIWSMRPENKHLAKALIIELKEMADSYEID
tara:strand:- start:49 stop:477 length:429 start_codon:yes stop_codon:yes gene_type:complete